VRDQDGNSIFQKLSVWYPGAFNSFDIVNSLCGLFCARYLCFFFGRGFVMREAKMKYASSCTYNCDEVAIVTFKLYRNQGYS
jgi:hypothetical protein